MGDTKASQNRQNITTVRARVCVEVFSSPAAATAPQSFVASATVYSDRRESNPFERDARRQFVTSRVPDRDSANMQDGSGHQQARANQGERHGNRHRHG